jgi:Protein of unknown function (DUF4065)
MAKLMKKKFPKHIKQVFDEKKFAELVVYIAHKSKDDPRFGAVKLNKILYYSDFYAYRLNGCSITGAEYQHLAEGPAPTALLPIRKKLITSKRIKMVQEPYYNGVQHRINVVIPPNESIFDSGELIIVDEIVKWLWNYSGRDVTEVSHKETGWLLTEEGQTIPYRSAWLSTEPLTEEQIELGKEVAQRHGLARRSA